MSYKKASGVLPARLIELIQQYVDGELIYIPKKECNKIKWGTNTDTRSQLKERNKSIYFDYSCGATAQSLAEKYFLSEKSIQRILLQEKNSRKAGV